MARKKYTQVEVEGVCEADGVTTCSPENAERWGVYFRTSEGFADWEKDFPTKDKALAAAKRLAEKHGIPMVRRYLRYRYSTRSTVLWAVEHKFAYGWDVVGWSSDGEPEFIFETKREAEDAIKEFLGEFEEESADTLRIVSISTEKELQKTLAAWEETQ